MNFYEEYFGIKYTLPKFDMVSEEKVKCLNLIYNKMKGNFGYCRILFYIYIVI